MEPLTDLIVQYKLYPDLIPAKYLIPSSNELDTIIKILQPHGNTPVITPIPMNGTLY